MKWDSQNVHVIIKLKLACISICQNCTTTATNCTSCDPSLFRVISGNTCICGTRFGT